MRDYKVGDKVWYIPGYSCRYLLVVECVITEVDDEFRKKDPRAYQFYWIDEPVGHGLDVNDLFTNLHDAERELNNFVGEYKIYGEKIEENAQLDTYRQSRIDFILKTHDHETDQQLEEAKKKWLAELPVKEYGKQWFNVKNMNSIST